uniref:Chitin synthase export chaperone n=1 Tax=Blastobotrys adeninivorans TaxID=409370 RepID=A0A060T1H9_BLAAD
MAFGQFDFLCEKAPIPLCLLVGPYDQDTRAAIQPVGIPAGCYSRSINLSNTMIFEVGSDFMHIGALLVVMVMLFAIRSKYTAIGRTEILDFFYMFIVQTALSLVIDAGVTPSTSGSFPYFVAVQCGLASALCACLMVNGFLGFQLWEDGTRRAVFGERVASVAAFALTFVISLFTFKGWGGGALSPTNTTALFVVLYILNLLMVVIYFVSQLILSGLILKDIWALGAVLLGAAFFGAGQALLYAFNNIVCRHVSHYVDGLFFATLCNMFTVMMIYKYWDIVTREDLEFSVSNRDSAWEVKELLEDERRYDNGSEYAGSTYALNQHPY